MRLRLILLLLAGIVAPTNLFCKQQVERTEQTLVRQAWTIVDQKFIDPTFNHHDPQWIRNEFVDVTYQTSDAERAAVRSMLQLLGDPQTRFLEPAQLASTIQEFTGETGGVGLADPWVSTIRNSGELKLLHLIADSPVSRAGLRPGDVIEAIDGTPTKNLLRDEMLMRIRGKLGSTVQLSIRRDQEHFTVGVRRKPTTSQTVHTTISTKNGKTWGYVALDQFGKNSAKEMRDAVADLLTRNAQGIVLDLRNNPGGFVPASRDIASMFLSQQQTIYRSLDRTGIGKDVTTDVSPLTTKPLVLIVNGATASAAEILAGALQNNHRALLIGTKTFGQGLIHSVQPLRDGSGLIIAVGRFQTPNGMEVHHVGIVPDEQVDGNEENLAAKATDRDPQYVKAVSVLLDKIGSKNKS